MLADPVSIQFRLPDGAEVAQTPLAFDAIVCPVESGVEVYQFWNWIPVASHVESFDGYVLKDITSSRRFFSILVHFSGHWIAYLVALGLWAFFASFNVALHAIPKQGWCAAVRWVGFAFLGVVGSFCFYGVLMFGPASPLVLGACFVIVRALVRVIQRKRLAVVG